MGMCSTYLFLPARRSYSIPFHRLICYVLSSCCSSCVALVPFTRVTIQMVFTSESCCPKERPSPLSSFLYLGMGSHCIT